MSAPLDRITVSEDKLRAVMAEFELRIVRSLEDKFERKADMAMLTEARKTVMQQGDAIDELQRWQSYIKGALAVLGLAFGVLVAVVVNYL